MSENDLKIKNSTHNIDKWLKLKLLKMNYRNLVFKGGGIRGIAYLGALEELERLGLLEKIQNVAGSSVGAIAALMVSLRLPAREVKEAFDTLDFSRVPQARAEGPADSILSKLDLATCSQRLLKHYGWYSSAYFHDWLKDLIAGYTGGNREATFADFKRMGFRGLYVVVSNLTKRCAEVMSAEKTPDVVVADAVRMSMSIPLYFEALHFDGQQFGKGDLYVDGGFFNNYPVDVFDKVGVIEKLNLAKGLVNWRTLGLYLYTEKIEEKTEPAQPSTVIEFIKLLIENFYTTNQLTAPMPGELDLQRTIQIGDCGVSSTNFSIKPGDDAYIALFESGQTAVRSFFEGEYKINKT